MRRHWQFIVHRQITVTNYRRPGLYEELITRRLETGTGSTIYRSKT